MESVLSHPVNALLVNATAVLAASFLCGLLARSIIASRWGRSGSGEALAGLVCCGPCLIVVAAQWFLSDTMAVAPLAAGTAVTYLFLAPTLLTGGDAGVPSWSIWRRAVLPFLVAVSVMWLLIAAGGAFTWLKGQFLITLFVLGTWLFVADRPALDEPETAASGPAGFGVGLGIVISVAAIGLSIAAAVVLLESCTVQKGSFAKILPILGAIGCIGPLILARRGRRSGQDWLPALGYSSMAAYCLAPGLAIFVPALQVALQTDRTARPVYVPDAAMVAMVSVVVLGLDGTKGRGASGLKWLLGAVWMAWIGWVAASALGR